MKPVSPTLTLLLLLIACSLLGWTGPVHAAKQGHKSKALKAGTVFRDCRSCPYMVVLPHGNFEMGSSEAEEGRGDDEGPVHVVHVATFALSKTEITRAQYAAFVKQTKYITDDKCWTLEDGKYEQRSQRDWRIPGFPQKDSHPAVCINWNDAQAYAAWLSHKTGKKYRLPSEAEWEYAARGNTSSARYWGEDPSEAMHYANTADQSAQAHIQGASSWSVHQCSDGYAYTAPVGSFKANAFGLYDMLGNVMEWTGDGYHPDYQNASSDGNVWQGAAEKRVLRGGSWNNAPRNVRSAMRDPNKPSLRFSIFGIRLARQLP